MKIISFCFIVAGTYAGNPAEVAFSTGPWQAVLAEAKRANKPIFIDFYTTWCGPCIKMGKEAFPDARVSKFFNTHFVNHKVDAEKGEGIDLAKAYRVQAFPTLIFVTPAEEVIYCTEGYESIEWLLAEAGKVTEATKNVNYALADRQGYPENAGDRTKTKAYLQQLAKRRQPVGRLLDEYIKSLPVRERTSTENLAIMAGTVSTTNSLVFDILLEQLPSIRSTPVGREAFITMPAAIASDFRKTVETGDERALAVLLTKHKKMLSNIGELAPELVDQQLLQERIDFYRQTQRYEQYHALASFYVHSQLLSQSSDSLRLQDERAYQEFWRRVVAPDSVRRTSQFAELSEAMKHRASAGVADGLNAVARAYFESITTPQYLTEALGWASRALELYPGPVYRETYACLLYRLGQKEAAVQAQMQAVAEAKQQTTLRIPPEAFSEVLEKMKKGSL